MTTITELQELADIIWPNDKEVNFDYLINYPERIGYAAALMKGLINSHKKQISGLSTELNKQNGIAKRKTRRMARTNEVLSRVNNGDTYEAIGKDLGFTRQNVSHIVNKYQDKSK